MFKVKGLKSGEGLLVNQLLCLLGCCPDIVTSTHIPLTEATHVANPNIHEAGKNTNILSLMESIAISCGKECE